MKNATLRNLIKKIDNWRELKAHDEKEYTKTCESCKHDFVVCLSTKYQNDGLGDPDFYSAYKCLECGASVDQIANSLYKGKMIDMNLYKKFSNYSEEERFAILEFTLRQIVEKNPQCTISEAKKILKDKFAQ